MRDFVEIARIEDIPAGTAKVVRVGAADVALFNLQGRLYAIDDACIHAGTSLATGRVRGHVVTCRGHGWQFDITNGRVVGVPGLTIDRYAVEVIEGRVHIGREPLA